MNVKTTTKQPKCMTQDCPNASAYRGVCRACYEACRRLVHGKRTSWRKLEKDGFVKPRASKILRSRVGAAMQRMIDSKKQVARAS